ncbi:hypothetical protein ACSBR2_015961 [Camellia fascicularis]
MPTVQSLQFDLGTIQVTTNSFSDDNKIGEGGFGSVYKGILSGGQEIAVKRLSQNSRQGTKEFKNEDSRKYTGIVEDCCHDYETIDSFNGEVLHPLLHELVTTSFFSIFKVWYELTLAQSG